MNHADGDGCRIQRSAIPWSDIDRVTPFLLHRGEPPQRQGGRLNEARDHHLRRRAERSLAESSWNGSSATVVLVPVYNDWASLAQLLPELDRVLQAHDREADVLVVDDGSTIEPAPTA